MAKKNVKKTTNKKPIIIAGIGAGIAAIAVGLGKAFASMKASAVSSFPHIFWVNCKR